METFLPFFVAAAKPVLLSISGLSILMGLLAIASPRVFAEVTTRGNRCIDTGKFFGIPESSRLRALDRWIDLDGYALPYSRPIGIGMCMAASLLLYLAGKIA
jgi:hypothetical protein